MFRLERCVLAFTPLFAVACGSTTSASDSRDASSDRSHAADAPTKDSASIVLVACSPSCKTDELCLDTIPSPPDFGCPKIDAGADGGLCSPGCPGCPTLQTDCVLLPPNCASAPACDCLVQAECGDAGASSCAHEDGNWIVGPCNK
jgi:hypothetical protein